MPPVLRLSPSSEARAVFLSAFKNKCYTLEKVM